ncbi:MAG: DUF5689 domain-containing protein [Muribaculaceae bacterium]|nr:DUF5689 domain-containing protein [Muribaculaceae bacterium]
MKPYKTLIAAALAMAAAGSLVSCDDDFDRPPVITPVATYEVNTPISEFKEMFWSYTQSNSYTTIPVNAEGDSIIVGGRITSSDLQGNIYQTLVVEDETGALYFGVNMYDINEKYQYGQEVRINVTGMIVGGYNGLLQVGGIYNGGLGRMEEAMFTTHAQVNGLPDKAKAQDMIVDVTMDQLKEANQTVAGVQQWQCMFVRFSNVHFNGGGTLKWTDNPGNTGYSNRTLIDAAGNELSFRTSNKSTFAGETLPAGNGNVVALLSYYRDNWQLVMMDPATDCTDFDGKPSEPSGPTGDDIYAESFKDGNGGFVIENVTAPTQVPEIWKHDSKYGYMIATAYANGSNYASESWLISPIIDLTGQKKAYLSYDQALNYFSSAAQAKSEARVAIREEGATAWTMLNASNWPSSLSWDFSTSGDIDITAFVGKKVQIGFCYSSTATKAGTWELKNVVIRPTGNAAPSTPDIPDTPTGDNLYSALSEDATSIDWTYENNSTDAVETIWTWKEYNGKHYLNGSAFVSNVAYASTAYAISPVIDLTAATSAKLTFDHAAKFQTTLKELCGLVVRVEGTTDWTQLTIPTWPAAGAWTFVNCGEIDLAQFAGKKIQVGLKYGSSTQGADTWEVKNLKITK